MGNKIASVHKEVFYRVEFESIRKDTMTWDGGESYERYWSGDDQDFLTMQEAALSAVHSVRRDKWRIIKLTINSETIREVIG